jgi:hypothetical protein
MHGAPSDQRIQDALNSTDKLYKLSVNLFQVRMKSCSRIALQMVCWYSPQVATNPLMYSLTPNPEKPMIDTNPRMCQFQHTPTSVPLKCTPGLDHRPSLPTWKENLQK